MWLLQGHLDQLLDGAGNGDAFSSQFHIKQEGDLIYCTPKQSLLSQRDELIAKLQSGDIFAIDMRHSSQTFKEMYTSSAALEKHLSETPSIAILGAFAVSEKRLFGLSDDAERELGPCYLDLNVSTLTWSIDHAESMRFENGQNQADYIQSLITLEVPGDIRGLVLDHVTQRVLLALSDNDEATRRIDDLLIKDQHYHDIQAHVSSFAKKDAFIQWESLKDTPDKDPKFQMADVLTAITRENYASIDRQVLQAVAEQKDSELVAADKFMVTMSELEAQNEDDFSKFWAEKVSQRVYNYYEGLKAIEETKLKEQLTDLLSIYLQKDLLPDAISKARLQGLVRSRKTRKSVNRFEAALKASKSDLFSVLSTLEKFGRKQGLMEIDVKVAEVAKRETIQDMIRRMQRAKTDAPSMFLSLVVVLFAKQHQGMIYATGKFAPKLLKQLKTELGGEAYEQVEKWKDSAKAGSLSNEERMAMLQMVEQAS